MSFLALWNCHHAESTVSSTTCGGFTSHFIDAVCVRVNLAGKTITAATFTLDLDTIIRHDIAERRSGLQVDWIPSELDKGAAISVCVGPGHIRGPVAIRIRRGTPSTCGCCINAWRVDIETTSLVSIHLLRS